MEDLKTIWHTKYATTKGDVVQAKFRPESSELYGWAVENEVERYGGRIFVHIGRTAFYTKEEAQEAAKIIRASRIKSLKKQIAQIEKLGV